MKSLRCLRAQQARISGGLRPRAPTCLYTSSARRSLLAPSPSRSVPTARSFSRTSRALVEGKGDANAELSDHKPRRLDRLASLQDGEDALSKEPFPRLEHRTETMSVAEFLDAHKDVEARDPSFEPVTLYGMLQHRLVRLRVCCGKLSRGGCV